MQATSISGCPEIPTIVIMNITKKCQACKSPSRWPQGRATHTLVGNKPGGRGTDRETRGSTLPVNHQCHVRNCVLWALLPSARSLSQPPVLCLVPSRPRHVLLTLTAWSSCRTDKHDVDVVLLHLLRLLTITIPINIPSRSPSIYHHHL